MLRFFQKRELVFVAFQKTEGFLKPKAQATAKPSPKAQAALFKKSFFFERNRFFLSSKTQRVFDNLRFFEQPAPAVARSATDYAPTVRRGDKKELRSFL